MTSFCLVPLHLQISLEVVIAVIAIITTRAIIVIVEEQLQQHLIFEFCYSFSLKSSVSAFTVVTKPIKVTTTIRRMILDSYIAIKEEFAIIATMVAATERAIVFSFYF